MAATLAPTDYRALVCIFLDGGNDGNNMIVPLDTAALQHVLHDARAAPRASRSTAGRSSSITPLERSAIPSASIRACPSSRRSSTTSEPRGRLQRRPAGSADHARGVQERRAAALPALLPLGPGRPSGRRRRADTREHVGWGGRDRRHDARRATTARRFPIVTSTWPASSSSASAWTRRRCRSLRRPDAFEPGSRALGLQRLDARRSRAEPRWTPSAACETDVDDDRRHGRRHAAGHRRSARRSPPIPSLVDGLFPNTELGNQLKQVAKLIKLQPDLADALARTVRSSSASSAASTRTRTSSRRMRTCSPSCPRP